MACNEKGMKELDQGTAEDQKVEEVEEVHEVEDVEEV